MVNAVKSSPTPTLFDSVHPSSAPDGCSSAKTKDAISGTVQDAYNEFLQWAAGQGLNATCLGTAGLSDETREFITTLGKPLCESPSSSVSSDALRCRCFLKNRLPSWINTCTGSIDEITSNFGLFLNRTFYLLAEGCSIDLTPSFRIFVATLISNNKDSLVRLLTQSLQSAIPLISGEDECGTGTAHSGSGRRNGLNPFGSETVGDLSWIPKPIIIVFGILMSAACVQQCGGGFMRFGRLVCGGVQNAGRWLRSTIGCCQ